MGMWTGMISTNTKRAPVGCICICSAGCFVLCLTAWSTWKRKSVSHFLYVRHNPGYLPKYKHTAEIPATSEQHWKQWGLCFSSNTTALHNHPGVIRCDTFKRNSFLSVPKSATITINMQTAPLMLYTPEAQLKASRCLKVNGPILSVFLSFFAFCHLFQFAVEQNIIEVHLNHAVWLAFRAAQWKWMWVSFSHTECVGALTAPHAKIQPHKVCVIRQVSRRRGCNPPGFAFIKSFLFLVSSTKHDIR